MFWNYKVILDQCGSSRGHRIRDKRYIFIPWGTGLAAAAQRAFSLSPPSLTPHRQGITGQWLCRLLNTTSRTQVHILGSAIHTWINSHNCSEWRSDFSFNKLLCRLESDQRVGVQTSVLFSRRNVIVFMCRNGNKNVLGFWSPVVSYTVQFQTWEAGRFLDICCIHFKPLLSMFTSRLATAVAPKESAWGVLKTFKMYSIILTLYYKCKIL